MSTPYLGKLTRADREFFNERTEGKSIPKKDRIEKDEPKKHDSLLTRDERNRG